MEKTILKLTRLLPIFVIIIIAGCSALSLPAGLSYFETTNPVIEIDDPSQTTLPPVSVPQELLDEQDILVNLYSRVNPSVVNISIYGKQGDQVFPLSQGSGFLYDNEGHIVTNAHVVSGADQVDVTFSEGTIQPARIVGQDPHSDLAVIKVDQVPGDLLPLVLGKMDQLAVGQSVVAIGNPFGLDGTLTLGVISALGRTIPALTPFSIPESIQTDAAINPGNSGGPLLNLDGEVIGVNAQIETDGTSRSNSGIGFAIPVRILERVIPELIEQGKFEWSWMGVQGGDVFPVLAEAMGLENTRGAYIAAVAPGGPAEKAGLIGANQESVKDGRLVVIGGDIITGINDQEVRSFDDLLIYIANQSNPGDEVVLTVLRNGLPLEILLTLESRPEL
jgi:2-alkenal reductase